MIDGPRLPQASLVRQVEQAWAVRVDGIRPVVGGEDSHAWAYELRCRSGRYFLKVRGGPFEPSAAVLAAHLRDAGLRGVVAPVPTTAGALWHHVDGHTALLYPFVAGETAARRGLSVDQWVEYGRLVADLHAVRLPAGLAATLPAEAFQPTHLGTLDAVTARIRQGPCDSRPQRAVARLWHAHAEVIDAVARRTAELAPVAAARDAPHVLCHADIHRANLVVDAGGGLHVVDWDEAMLAPRERDLMFVVGSAIAAATPTAEQEAAFWRGYGDHDVDWPVLAYYRYDWAVQDLADFAHRVFFRDDLGEAAKQAAATILATLFEPGDEVDTALSSEAHLGH